MILDGQASTKTLPFWAQLAGFATAIILGIVKLFETFPAPKLHVNATRDIFFRFGDYGEAIFSNAVLLSTGIPVLIVSVAPSLRRSGKKGDIGRSEKRFPMFVANHGEKVKGAQNTADNHFYGSSALYYLPANTPFRAVYLCLQQEYAEGQRKAMNDFDSSIAQLRVENLGKDLAEVEEREELLAKMNGLVDSAFNALNLLIQMEEGTYEFLLRISYKGTRWWWRRFLYHSESGVSFSVTNEMVDGWRNRIRASLVTRASQMLAGEALNYTYAELVPTDAKEDDSPMG